MSTLLNRIKPRIDSLRLKLYFLLAIKWSKSSRKKRILIVKNDSIGDYIIFRNFLNEIKNSKKFRDYELYLLTTLKLKNIAGELDGDVLKEILLYDRKELINVENQLRFYDSIRSYKFEYLVYPTYSPDSWTQHLIKYLAAKYKIGFNGDLSNQTERDKVYFERYYTHLVSIGKKFSHEFEKNVDFFTDLLEQDVVISKPELVIESKKLNKILICPGAQHEFRIWSLANFAKLITALHEKFPDASFEVATGPGEENLFTGIAGATKVPLSNFKIDSIAKLAKLMSAVRLIVCNDSSAAHIAVAVNSRSVCISNGNHFRRFIPYPEKMSVAQKVVLPKSLIEVLENNEAGDKYYFGSTLNINEITVEDVFRESASYLNEI